MTALVKGLQDSTAALEKVVAPYAVVTVKTKAEFVNVTSSVPTIYVMPVAVCRWKIRSGLFHVRIDVLSRSAARLSRALPCFAPRWSRLCYQLGFG